MLVNVCMIVTFTFTQTFFSFFVSGFIFLIQFDSTSSLFSFISFLLNTTRYLIYASYTSYTDHINNASAVYPDLRYLGFLRTIMILV